MFVQGKITHGVSGLPIEGVHIASYSDGKLNVHKGSVSNQNGEYMIDAYPQEEIRISHIGFATETLPGMKLITSPNLKLFPSSETLDEITLKPKKKKLWPWLLGIAAAAFVYKKTNS